MNALTCTGVDCNTRMFTPGREYPIYRECFGDAVEIIDDIGAVRVIGSSNKFIIRNDAYVLPQPETTIFYARFAPTEIEVAE